MRLGLRANAGAFGVLLLINAFVGGMVGMERSILPDFAEARFGLASRTAVLSFIVAFGLSKAMANYHAGRLANRWGRRKVLLAGWALAIPVPFLLMHAPSWNWVLVANVLLGISQGLAWSSTVVMKMDLVGPGQRGLAMGLNEFSGYLAVGVVAMASAAVAQRWGVTPYPFWIGVGLSWAGLSMTALLVRDTRAHVQRESVTDRNANMGHVFLDTSFRNPTLSAVTQAGMVNNINDGMVWGLLPVWLAGLAFEQGAIGLVAGTYPAVWGLGQLFTGRMADRLSNKKMLVGGMLLQGIVLLALPFARGLVPLLLLAAALGWGTAMVYPTFLTVLGRCTTPAQRAESVGVFRLWRDLGYAAGALLSGWVADAFGLLAAILMTGILTLASAAVLRWRMPARACG